MVRKSVILLTDFGKESPFPGIMKGVIKSICPNTEVIDFTHEIRPYQIDGACFLLFTSYHYFPQGTIFVTVIDPGVGSERKIILVETRNYFFLAPDNGVLSWVLEREKPVRIINVDDDKYFLKPVSATFQGRDIFAPVAARLAGGERIENFGPLVKRIKQIPFPRVIRKGNIFTGKIIYVDHFGDLITNFSEKEFSSQLKSNNFSLKLKNKVLKQIVHSYAEVKKGNPCLLWGSFGFLEIALRESNLARKWRIGCGEKIILKIKK